jgi:hypothetical protein
LGRGYLLRSVRTPLLIALAVLAVALAAPAWAGNGTSQGGYGGQAEVQAKLATNSVVKTKSKPPAQQAQSAGTLPFTGTDLAFAVALGSALLAIGLGMRRLAGALALTARGGRRRPRRRPAGA